MAPIRAYLQSQTGEIGAGAGASTTKGPSDDAIAGGITQLASDDCLIKLLDQRAQRLQEALDRVRRLI